MGNETELKLRCRPADLTALRDHPRLQGADHERRQLVATYYDTPTLDLRSAGLALRVRQEGERWVQTLKTEGRSVGSLHLRQELNDPVEGSDLDRSKLPVMGDLGRVFDNQTLRANLAPVLVTDVTRDRYLVTDDRANRIECALDQGEVRANGQRVPLCEVELELLAGDVSALYGLGLDLSEAAAFGPQVLNKAELGYALLSGAAVEPVFASLPDLDGEASTETALVAILDQCLNHMLANEASVLAGQVEGVHQMRVALRRLKSCLSVFKPALAPQSSDPIKNGIRWLNEGLGPVRDWDVFQENLQPISDAFLDRPGVGRFVSEAVAIRARHFSDLEARLTSREFGRFVLTVGAWKQGKAWREGAAAEQTALLDGPLHLFAAKVLGRQYKRMVRIGADFDALPLEAKHALRLRAKSLRYTLQFFSNLYRKVSTRPMLKALAGLQDSLGVLNDLVVAERLLDEAGLDRADSTRSLIDGWYGARTSAQLEHAGAAWASFLGAPRPWKHPKHT
jgi:inorganic triphosphatase YgiF